MPDENVAIVFFFIIIIYFFDAGTAFKNGFSGDSAVLNCPYGTRIVFTRRFKFFSSALCQTLFQCFPPRHSLQAAPAAT